MCADDEKYKGLVVIVEIVRAVLIAALGIATIIVLKWRD